MVPVSPSIVIESSNLFQCIYRHDMRYTHDLMTGTYRFHRKSAYRSMAGRSPPRHPRREAGRRTSEERWPDFDSVSEVPDVPSTVQGVIRGPRSSYMVSRSPRPSRRRPGRMGRHVNRPASRVGWAGRWRFGSVRIGRGVKRRG